MNNYFYVAMQKALSWHGESEERVIDCIDEFNYLKTNDKYCLDDSVSAISCARESGLFPSELIDMFEVV